MAILFRTMLVLGTVLALLAGLAPIATPVTAQSFPRLIVETVLANGLDLKVPQVATAGSEVHLIGIAESSGASGGKVRVWTKNEGSISFPTPVTLGTTARGSIKPDFINSAIATSPDGEVMTLWIDQAAKVVRFRKRDTAGNWGPTFEVTRNIVFAVRPALTVVNGGPQSGRIIAVWRDDSGKDARNEGIYYTYSDNGGASWAPVQRAFGMKVYLAVVQLASGPNGAVALTFTRDTPRPLHVMVALWTGSGFSAPVDVNLGDGAGYADSSVAIYNDRIFVGYRHAEKGIFYAEKPLASLFDNQPWPRARLLNEKGDGQVTVSTDPYGNLHFSWIRTPADNRNQNRLGYAVRLANGTFLGPIESATSGPLFNAWGASSSASGFYLHVAHEQFAGEIPFLRYALFQAPGSPFGSVPLIEGGAERVGGDGRTSVQVTFPGLTAPHVPDQVRWRWDAPPTDTENDSGGWQAFTPTGPTSVLTVPIPPGLLTDDGCVERVLYTQLRRSADNLVDQVRSDAVIIDRGVRSHVVLANPFSRMNPFLTSVTGGARDGHPDYTRVPEVFVELRSLGDCSGLQRFALATHAAGLPSAQNVSIGGTQFVGTRPYPSTISEGPMPVVLRVYDALDNSMTVARTLTYDVTPPTLHGGTMQVQPIAGSPSIIVNLQFNNLSVTDNLYPGRGFWGVWLANSRSAVADPATDPNLVWIPVEAPGNGTSFSLVWSLASGLPETQVTAGTYYVYARVLDGAGNPSATVLPAATISIPTITTPKIFVPVVSR